MALVRKAGASKAPAVKKQVIQINPYENPENVLELMSKICSATPSVETDVYWNVIYDALCNRDVRGKSLDDYLKENRSHLYNGDFKHDIEDYCSRLSWALTARENTEHTQIVVAGGFSSGKSSFLNRLTNSVNLLPTGTEPVSVVKTYLYCSSDTKSISVRGVNQKNVLVDLNTGVLQAIQHASKSNVYLASVLDKLFVEIPSQELDGLAFIDTPGYNNSDKKNDSNGKTDKDTALEALSEGNVLFWFVGSDRPTITTDDMEIIRHFEGKKVVIFNKADKHGYLESKRIVEEGARVIYDQFNIPKEEIIDVIAFSSLENKVYYSLNNMTLSDIVKEAKRAGNGSNELNDLKLYIKILFNNEISACKNTISSIEQEYSNAVDDKEKNQKELNDIKYNDDDGITGEVREVLVNSYNEVLRAVNELAKSSSFAINSFTEFYNEVYYFRHDYDFWGNPGLLDKALKYGLSRKTVAVQKYDACKWTYYEEDYRKDVAKRVQDEIAGKYKKLYDYACERCKDLLERKTFEEEMIKDMQEYKEIFTNAVECGIKCYQQQSKATSVDDCSDEIPNVFDCIKDNNYKAFLHSFEDGVDLAVCNADGYSPLTLAVQVGNNMMVQFMLDHDADPAIKDRRGYNAFHTAVENQYRDICKILLDADPDLIDTKTASGETVEELANKHTFTKWIKNEIDNAF
jgi:GTP-binding protein EngB required for normal cell division